MTQKKDRHKNKLCAFRLSPEIIERLDNYVKVMGMQTPGMNFTRSDAVRVLLTTALDMTDRVQRLGRAEPAFPEPPGREGRGRV